MNQFFRKHWKHLFFTLATFFWVGCGDDSSSQVVLYGCPDDICKEDPETSSSGDLPASSSEEPGSSSSVDISSSAESSSSVESSTSIDDFAAVYGPPIPCYSTTIQNDAGKTFDIFECQNGGKYLKDADIYGKNVKDELPEDVQTEVPAKSPFFANNCEEVSLCVDGVDAEGTPTGGCHPTLECPPKEEPINPANN